MRFLYPLGLAATVGLTIALDGTNANDKAFRATASPQIAEVSSEEARSEAEIRRLSAQWFAAWSPGRGSVDWEVMGQLFAQGDGRLLVFDDAGGRVVVLESWEEYRATWEPFMEQFPEWQIEPEGEIDTIVSGDLATTAFTLAGGGRDRDGNTVKFRQRGTHVWQRTNGRWAIVREHLTTD